MSIFHVGVRVDYKTIEAFVIKGLFDSWFPLVYWLRYYPGPDFLKKIIPLLVG